MTEYFGAGMRLYLERLVDWDGLLGLRRGSGVDVKADRDITALLRAQHGP